MQDRKPIRVAIVGSGMAGLVTAYLLNRDPRQRFDVTIFESVRALRLFAHCGLLTVS
jgi:2-polyprenyl-6-methoxyphenol hydroxylase-like FAD-dependent oxidoreductase